MSILKKTILKNMYTLTDL